MADKPGPRCGNAVRGRDDGASTTTVLPALGAWKPAKDAGFHIPNAPATAAAKSGQTAKPTPIVHFYRFSCRTNNPKCQHWPAIFWPGYTGGGSVPRVAPPK